MSGVGATAGAGVAGRDAAVGGRRRPRAVRPAAVDAHQGRRPAGAALVDRVRDPGPARRRLRRRLPAPHRTPRHRPPPRLPGPSPFPKKHVRIYPILPSFT